jgi:DNA topoisomerase VI subunit B
MILYTLTDNLTQKKPKNQDKKGKTIGEIIPIIAPKIHNMSKKDRKNLPR